MNKLLSVKGWAVVDEDETEVHYVSVIKPSNEEPLFYGDKIIKVFITIEKCSKRETKK